MSKFFTAFYCIIFSSLISFAQSGELDLSFAIDGILLMDLGGTDTQHDIVVQPDGKILVAGLSYFGTTDFAAVRFLEDGTLDSTFATNGVFHYESTNGTDLLYDIELLNDGSILLAGSYRQPLGSPPANSDFLIMKLTTDGELDNTFGDSGIVIQEIGVGLDYAREMTITEDGQIAICGYANVPFSGGSQLNVIVLLNADGTVDTSFGQNGLFIWNDIDIATEMYSIAIAPDGNFLVSGFANLGGVRRIAIYKVLADGSGLDTSFGANGETLLAIEGEGHSIQVHPNGNILVAGHSIIPGSGSNLVILAFHQDGTSNLDFGVDGIFEADAQELDYGFDLAIQSDGKIIILGESGQGPFAGTPTRTSTARCDAHGVLDTTWGETGIVETITSEAFTLPKAIAIQPLDGKVLVTGGNEATGGNDIVVIRYGNFVDADGDGSPLGEDCDETNADIFLGNTETPYNGIDDDCDPLTPDDDLDGDGFVLADDCDDMNSEINPDAVEIPDNDVDEDCDGDVSTAVHESVLSQQFSVFPNPTNDVVFINYENPTLRPSKTVIIDVVGRVLRTIQNDLGGGQITIPLTDFPSGILILAIHTDQGVAVKRIVKK